MKYLGYRINTGAKNMQIDAEMLENAISNNETQPLFRLYGWKPMCISLGRNQKDNFISTQIDVVRRLTGGRALLHDNEVTYSYVSKAKEGQSIIESYKEISGILIDFFKTLGVTFNFGENKRISTHFDYCMLISTGADVCYNGNKIIGSAQCRKNGYILQHGSILFDYDKNLLEQLFNEKIEGITTIKEIMPEMTIAKFIKEFETYLSANYLS